VIPSPDSTRRVALAVNAEPLSVPSVSVPDPMPCGDCGLDHRDRLDSAAAEAELPADDLARAAVDDRVQVDQPCSATQIAPTSDPS
jgi:hypothetical protein